VKNKRFFLESLRVKNLCKNFQKNFFENLQSSLGRLLADRAKTVSAMTTTTSRPITIPPTLQICERLARSRESDDFFRVLVRLARARDAFRGSGRADDDGVRESRRAVFLDGVFVLIVVGVGENDECHARGAERRHQPIRLLGHFDAVTAPSGRDHNHVSFFHHVLVCRVRCVRCVRCVRRSSNDVRLVSGADRIVRFGDGCFLRVTRLVFCGARIAAAITVDLLHSTIGKSSKSWVTIHFFLTAFIFYDDFTTILRRFYDDRAFRRSFKYAFSNSR
jgi:hypothetical protein